MSIKISLLPFAGPLNGTEGVPVVQAGITKRTTAAAIAALGGGGGGGGGSTTLTNNLTTGATGTALDAAQGPVITQLIGAKFTLPAGGTTGQYVTGTGSLATFPTFGTGTVTSVGLTAPAAGITVTGGNITTSGSHALGLSNDLAAVEGLAGTGIAQRTGTDAWTLLQLDTDTALAANSDTRIATQKAVKAYTDQVIAAADAMVFRGVVDCSANPLYPAADAGWTYRVSVAGKIGGGSGVAVEAGDLLMCLVDGTLSGTQAAVGTSWGVTQANIDGAVIGPASAVDGQLAVFNGTSGKIVRALAVLPVANGGTGTTTPGVVPGANVTITGTWPNQTISAGKPGGVTVTASRDLAAGDIGNELICTTGSAAIALNITSGFGAALDVIFLRRQGANLMTVTAGAGATLRDPWGVLSTAIPNYGGVALQCEAPGVWIYSP